MNQASWLGFGISSTVTKTFLHFLPAAAGIGAPYPIDLKIAVGGSSLPRRTLSIDGARLGHPDGFRLEEAIPALSQQVSGLYLLQIDLSPLQHRIDLSSSCIIIEVQYQQGAVRYMPRRIISSDSSDSVHTKSPLPNSNKDSAERLGPLTTRGIFNPRAINSIAFALRDPSLFASLVILNGSSESIIARITGARSHEVVGSVTIPPDSVKENEMSDIGLNHPSKLDSTWGALDVEAFTVSFERAPIIDSENSDQNFTSDPILGAAASAYVVYRDRNSRRISSVIAI